MKARYFSKLLIITLFVLGCSGIGHAQVSITQPNTPVVQNFDGLGAAAQAPLPSGWRMDTQAQAPSPNGTNPNAAGNYNNSQTQTTIAGTGSASNGGAYNFGNGSNAADRAIGFVASGALLPPRNMFVQIKNDTGQTISSLDISFNYEKYRTGPRSITMNFYAGINGINWSQVIADGTQNFPVDTNNVIVNPPASTPKSFNLPNVNIPPGESFYLRWEYVEGAGSGARQGIGIDDVSITARTSGTTTPTIITTPNTLGDFGAVSVGTTSAERSYTITGSNLTDNITVSAPPEFLVSATDGGPYAPSITIPQNGGSVPSTTVYVVFAPTSTGAKSGTITNASAGAPTQNLTVGGTAAQNFAVNGQVTYKGSQPLTGVMVNAFQNGQVAGSSMTDANGGYTLNLAGGGNYVISVATAPFAFAPAEQAVPNLSGNQSVNFSAVAATVLISEFRFRGVNEADEFVELYNNSDFPVDISGFALASPDNPAPKYVAPGNVGSRTTIIPARRHFLVTGPGYSLSSYAAGDGTFAADIPDGAGIGLFLNASNISLNTRIDAVGFASASVPFAEGTPLNPSGGITAVDTDASFVRNFGQNLFPVDSDNNAADFLFVSTTAGNFNGVQSILGAPGPENRQSPVFNPANIAISVFDSGAGLTAAPNRVTDPANTSPLAPRGTIASRRTYTNNTGLAINRFRLRVVGITTVGSPQIYTPQAIVRVLNSADVNVTKTDGSTVLVRGLTLEAPPNQPQAGGLNSSLIVNLSAPINPGESINVDTLLGVVESGRLVFNTAVEADLAAPPSANENLVMGNPSNAVANINQPCNYLLEKAQYVLSYCRDRGIPNWVSWHLDTSWLGSAPRQDDFREDTTLPAGWYQVQETDYQGSGFDRGHHTPSADRTRTIPDNSATFLMTNMMPQAPDNNQGPWANMENAMRDIARAGNELYVVMGGFGNGGTGSNGGTTNVITGGRVAVPNVVWKVVLVLPVADGNDVARVNENTRVIAVIMPNTQGIRNNDWKQYRVSVDQVEQLTGLDFFSNVPAAIQNVIESRVDNQP